MPEYTPIQLARLEERRGQFTRPGFLLLLCLLAALLAGPWLTPSFKVMDVVTKIMIFAVAVASYDVLIGYTGIVSFAHGMFFGLGGYCLALVIYRAGQPAWHHFFSAAGLAVLIAAVLALAIVFFTLRVRAIFFAMMTLAFAEFAYILGMQWSSLTRGEDGVSFKLPGIFSVTWSGGTFLGTEINGRLMTYYLILGLSTLLFLLMIRFVRSPLGRVLESIRENEQRSTALGHKTFRYQIVSAVFSSVLAALAGMMFAMWVGYVNPSSILGTGLMLNILLMVTIGGQGTLFGAIIGSAFLNIAQTFLPDLERLVKALFPHFVLLQRSVERWLLLFGILFILVVFFFPKGILGTIRDYARRAGPSERE
ncbi:MAG: branched-chain amino acid ABC transporter permease [Thermodesulfobacteriota bacterium]